MTHPFSYDSEWGTSYHSTRRVSAEAERLISIRRGQKVQPWIKPNDRVFEFGVGLGWNLATVQCFEKAGYDVATDLQKDVQKKGIHFFTSEDEIPASYFDVVILHHVLEHVPSPATTLRRLTHYLKTAGRLLVYVPFESKQRFSRWQALHRHHLFSWTPLSLAQLLRKEGWHVDHQQIQPFRFDRFAAQLASRLRAGLKGYSLIRAVGLRVAPEFEIFTVVHLSR